ncbi:MAG: hypothetical protein FJ083_11725 [Cyanobacteria bacterium K_Offshore_surface_m2_239]|nr:hypothetical protein [Cyanobacteria bacterium K_Offshore_surface_m2_239]
MRTDLAALVAPEIHANEIQQALITKAKEAKKIMSSRLASFWFRESRSKARNACFMGLPEFMWSKADIHYKASVNDERCLRSFLAPSRKQSLNHEFQDVYAHGPAATYSTSPIHPKREAW